MRRILGRRFEKPTTGPTTYPRTYWRPALAIAAFCGVGCADGSIEIDAEQPPALEAATGEVSVLAGSDAAPPGSRGSEALVQELHRQARGASGQMLVAVDERLRDAESEFPLEFRFSYERARLGVFGRDEHHEAFGRLRRAAEKAIETGRSEAMLAMLRSDEVSRGAFSKLRRGHSEWHQIVAALEQDDRAALWHAAHETETAHRAVPEAHAEAEAQGAARSAVLSGALNRLRLVRARVGRLESSSLGDGVAADSH